MTTTISPLAPPGTRNGVDTARSFPSALHSEWIKATSLRSNAAIATLAAGVSGFATWAVAYYVTDEPLSISGTFTFATVFTAVFASVAGILLFSSESQHGTLAPMLTAQPSRAVVAAAKTVSASVFGAALGCLGLLAGASGAMIGGLEVGPTTTISGDAGRAVLFTVLASVLGLGIGMITRHSAAAISGLLVWWLVVENLLLVFVSEKFARFMPFRAGNSLLDTGPELESSDLMLSATENAVVFGGYALAAVIAGTVLLNLRDNN